MASIKNIFSSRADKNGEFFNSLKKILGFKPKDLSIYETAFTHRSTNEKNNMSLFGLQWANPATMS